VSRDSSCLVAGCLLSCFPWEGFRCPNEDRGHRGTGGYRKKSFVFKERAGRAGRAEEGWLRGEKKMEISSESAESEGWVEEAGVAAAGGESAGGESAGGGGIHRRIKM